MTRAHIRANSLKMIVVVVVISRGPGAQLEQEDFPWQTNNVRAPGGGTSIETIQCPLEGGSAILTLQ